MVRVQRCPAMGYRSRLHQVRVVTAAGAETCRHIRAGVNSPRAQLAATLPNPLPIDTTVVGTLTARLDCGSHGVCLLSLGGEAFESGAAGGGAASAGMHVVCAADMCERVLGGKHACS